MNLLVHSFLAAANEAFGIVEFIVPMKPGTTEVALDEDGNPYRSSDNERHAELAWARNPMFNIGIPCSENKLTVLEFFGDEESVPEELHAYVIDTYCVRTPHSIQLYFRGLGRTSNLYNAVGQHIGYAKSGNSYVLAAGSVDEDGGLYEHIYESSCDWIPELPVDIVKKLIERAEVSVDQLSKEFVSHKNLSKARTDVLIPGFLCPAVTFLAGLPEQGKTFTAIAIAKALCAGEKLFGHFPVKEKVPVLFLCPESSGSNFRERIELFGLDKVDAAMFSCRTLTEGDPLRLDHPIPQAQVRKMKPVLILDSFQCFSEATDENSASQNKKMRTDVLRLRRLGARAVIVLHHANKTSGDKASTLQNSLRGTGDLGAMCDACIVLRRNNTLWNRTRELELAVINVKARDYEPVPDFTIVARQKDRHGVVKSMFETTGDFLYKGAEVEEQDSVGQDMESPVPVENQMTRESITATIRGVLTDGNKISKSQLAPILKARTPFTGGRNEVEGFMNEYGFELNDARAWVPHE